MTVHCEKILVASTTCLYDWKTCVVVCVWRGSSVQPFKRRMFVQCARIFARIFHLVYTIKGERQSMFLGNIPAWRSHTLILKTWETNVINQRIDDEVPRLTCKRVICDCGEMPVFLYSRPLIDADIVHMRLLKELIMKNGDLWHKCGPNKPQNLWHKWKEQAKCETNLWHGLDNMKADFGISGKQRNTNKIFAKRVQTNLNCGMQHK